MNETLEAFETFEGWLGRMSQSVESNEEIRWPARQSRVSVRDKAPSALVRLMRFVVPGLSDTAICVEWNWMCI